MRETLADLRIVARGAAAVGQRDVDRGNRARARLAAIARPAAEQPRDLLGAANLADLLVADGPATVARDAERVHLAGGERFAAHRFHRIAPELAHLADDRHAPYQAWRRDPGKVRLPRALVCHRALGREERDLVGLLAVTQIGAEVLGLSGEQEVDVLEDGGRRAGLRRAVRVARIGGRVVGERRNV